MVRLQTASNQFNAGARVINRYLREQGYKETAVLHTLAPSNTDPEGLGSSNMTSDGGLWHFAREDLPKRMCKSGGF